MEKGITLEGGGGTLKWKSWSLWSGIEKNCLWHQSCYFSDRPHTHSIDNRVWLLYIKITVTVYTRFSIKHTHSLSLFHTHTHTFFFKNRWFFFKEFGRRCTKAILFFSYWFFIRILLSCVYLGCTLRMTDCSSYFGCLSIVPTLRLAKHKVNIRSENTVCGHSWLNVSLQLCFFLTGSTVEKINVDKREASKLVVIMGR